MATRIPLILNQSTARIEELAAEDTLPGTAIEGLMGRNRIINGDFRFWQRGSSQAPRDTGYAPLYLAADRWYMAAATTQVGISRQEFAAGQTDVPGNPRWYMRVIANSGLTAASLGYFGQTLEGVGNFAGQTCTLSFYARGSVAAKLGSSFVQTFGASGSADVNFNGPTLNITTQWQRHQITVVIPSIIGKTIGSANDMLRLRLWMGAGANYNNQVVGDVGNQTWSLDIANVQWELGETATGFEQRPDAVELAICQRYYEKSYSTGIAPGTGDTQGYMSALVSAGGYFLSSDPVFKVSKRGTPAVGIFRFDTGIAGEMTEYSTTGSPVAGRPVTLANISTNGFQVRGNGSAVAGNNVRYQWTADAEL